MRCLLALLVISTTAAAPVLADHLPGEVLVVLKRPDVLTPVAGGLSTVTRALAAALAEHGLDHGEYVVHKTGPLSGRDRCYLVLCSGRAGFNGF